MLRAQLRLGRWALAGAVATALAGACNYDTDLIFDGTDGGVVGPTDGPPTSQVGDGPYLPPRVIPGNAPEHCADGQKTADESDVDCGGADCPTCGPTAACNAATDCFSKICNANVCAPFALDDGVQNGVESGVDCGGEAYAPKCAAGVGCRRDVDCDTGVCRGELCQAASTTDGLKNGTETDVDCGGEIGTVPRCANGRSCNQPSDCTSASCSVIEPHVCAPTTATNNVTDNGETAKDCGGPDLETPRCPTTSACVAGTDCQSGVCSSPGNVCQPPTGTDGVQNKDESDVDCGAATTGAPKCDVGKKCRTRADCKAGGCGIDHRCTDTPSCAYLAGGNSCGPTETAATPDAGASDAGPKDAGGNAQHESCCAEAALPSGQKLDKYLVTAGRMRAMVDQLDGDVHGYIAAAPPAWWNPEWTEKLPVIRADVDFQLGPWNYAEGCHLRYGGARTYDTDTLFTYGNGSTDRSALGRTTLDEKALNCMPEPLAAALCAFDGKKLATLAVLDEARKLGGAWPWGNDAPTAERSVHDFGTGPSYTFPAAATELSAHVAAPGRVPGGNTAAGHADLVGNLLPWVQDPNPDLRVQSMYSWTVDEGEGKLVTYAYETSYVIGARCMR